MRLFCERFNDISDDFRQIRIGTVLGDPFYNGASHDEGEAPFTWPGFSPQAALDGEDGFLDR